MFKYISVSPSVMSNYLWPMDCSPPGFSIHGILQVEILEWVAISISRGSSWPRDQTQVSCLAGRFFTIWATKEASSLCLAISNWIMEKMNRLNFTTERTSLYRLTPPSEKMRIFWATRAQEFHQEFSATWRELMDPNENKKTPSPPFFPYMYHTQSFTHLLS